MTECDLLFRIVPKAQYAMAEGHCSIQLGSGGCCNPLAGPGQIAGGGEATGSSEKFAFYSTKKRPKTLVWCIFSVLNTIIKSCQIQFTH